jgi:hypothetical protein
MPRARPADGQMVSADGLTSGPARSHRAGQTPPKSPAVPGHSVAVLLKIYAHCIDGQADAANKRIADALGGTDDSPDNYGQDDQAS